MKKTQNHTVFDERWLFKTIENLERSYWEEPEFTSYLVTTCHRLRKKQIKDFETEDLRIMIGQNLGLKYLIPLALDVLTKNILANGDFYEGDLLYNVLRSDHEYWKNEYPTWRRMRDLFVRNEALLNSFGTTNEIKKGWFKSFEEFKNIFPGY